MNILQQLEAIVGPQGIICGEAVKDHPACVFMHPKAVLRPASTEEVSQLMALCNEQGQAIVTRGGGSGLVGGTIMSSEEILLSLERMNQLEQLDVRARTAVVQAGVPLQTVQEAAADQDLFFPLDLGARGSATIGGNLATNAGGNRVVRYGMAREMALGLEVVMADGTVLNSMKSVIKNNTGYDLKQFFIGSEGTLGVITRAVLRLQAAPISHNTALVAVENFEQLIDLLGSADKLLGGGMSSFEVMWSNFYEAVCQGGERHRYPLANDYPYYVIIESLGADQAADDQRFNATLEQLFEQGLIADAVLAKSKAESEAIWAIRDDGEALMALFPYFVFDISVPLAHMESYVAAVHKRIDEAWPEDSCCITFGHLGDGNLHFVIRAAGEYESAKDKVNDIVYSELRERDGVVSAEHGIGLEKRPYLDISRSEAEIELMKTLKRAMDPNNILNPGKIFEL
ncbi:MAG: FAD-binding oxidoreductase [Cellvibrionaceae bacterium]|nr:FAD-binding oxidoreductase [Cellvibrionaceae bacterium]